MIAQAASASIQAVKALADIDYGAWQGLNAAQAEARDPDAYRRWLAGDDTAAAPGGERLIDVSQRAWDELSRVATAQRGDCVVIVSHDVVIKLLIALVLGLPIREYRNVPQHTTARNLLVNGDARRRVAFVNNARHLARIAT